MLGSAASPPDPAKIDKVTEVGITVTPLVQGGVTSASDGGQWGRGDGSNNRSVTLAVASVTDRGGLLEIF